MNEQDFITLMVEKLGLPGVILAGLGWAIYRFGPTPSHHAAPPMTNETAAAINAMRAEIADFRAEVADLRKALAANEKEWGQRVVRAEADIANIYRGQK